MVEDIWELFGREDNYQSFIITVRNSMLLTKKGTDWLRQYTNILQKQIIQALASVGETLGYSKEQIPGVFISGVS